MTSATAPIWPDGAGLFTRARLRFRAWRRTRPFWGGLLSVLGGLPILYFPYAHLTLSGVTMAMSTTAGAGSLVIGLLMMALGVSAWFQPATRFFCGIAVTILALISIPVSNLGGFVLGLLLGLIGGGLLCSWAPLKEPKAAAAPPVEAGVAMSVAATEQATVPEQATAAELAAGPVAELAAGPTAETAVIPEQAGTTEQAGDLK
ncbi:DUF6114 domain-containing protein [Kitasatospora sp. NBC_01287]|uniref:DUF6114 domain-containing protein n=1 Tax=Kitasatospora sp. NBC_01287 TaxID=2903573 RepID=UPI00224E1818|nr:DUF6114 domain-containing protein [Kitasatospora sp. NBC_01287]MCX4746703.1 DUF6114 domain-containing protein [Kitasatospora sp. NBC_01287]